MLKLPLSYFEQRFIGSIASRFDSISTIQRTISGNFVETVLDGFAALLMLVAMFFYSRVLGSIVVLSVLLYLAVKSANYRRLEQATQVYLARFGKQQTLLLETLRGIRPLRLFKREDQQEMRWQAILMDATNSQLDCEKISTLVRSSNVLIFGLETAAIVWLGGNKVISGSLTIGMFVAFLAFKEQFNVRIAALIDRLFDLRLLSAQLDRLADIVLTEPARSTDSDSRQGLTTGAVVIKKICGFVTAKHRRGLSRILIYRSILVNVLLSWDRLVSANRRSSKLLRRCSIRLAVRFGSAVRMILQERQGKLHLLCYAGRHPVRGKLARKYLIF